MTSTGQLGLGPKDGDPPPQEAHESRRGTRRRAGRFFSSRNKGTWFWIMVSLIALAGVALVFDGGSLKATLSGTSASTTAGGTPAATGGAPAAVGSGKASQVNRPPNSISKAKGQGPTAAQAAENGGALSLPTGMQSRVIAWQSGAGGKYLAVVTRLFGDALQAGGTRQYSQMRSACIQLTRSVSTAEAGPQIPVTTMQVLYGKALAELAKGAADCQAAIAIKPTGNESSGTTVNATKRQQATSELGAGARDIFRSTAEIEIASRQSH